MITDLGTLDRLVSRAALALLDGQGELLDTAYRDVAKQSVRNELLALSPKLAAHVTHLTIARVSGPAMREFDGAMTAPTEAVRDLPRTQTTDPRVSVTDALVEALAARSLEASRAWLAVVERASTPALDAQRHWREIADEVRKRLGEPEDRAIVQAADAFLARTSDLAASIATEPAAMFLAASAQSAGEGWPRRFSVQVVIDAFGTDAKSRRTIERMAAHSTRSFREPLGAASHIRAVRDVVFEWHARTPGDALFAERHDPEWTSAHASSLLVAAAIASPVFQKRTLGCALRAARAQARALAVTAFLAARTDAARLLPPTRDRGERLFGRPIAPIVPRPTFDARGRFRAWLALPVLLDRAVSLHDEDWFRNPRFWEEMAIRFATPPETIEGGDLAKAFEERLA